MSFAIEFSRWEGFWRFEGKEFTVFRFGWVSIVLFDRSLVATLDNLTRELAKARETEFDFEDDLYA